MADPKIYEEDITGLPPSVDLPILNLRPSSRSSQFSILNQASPIQPTPIGGTVEGSNVPTLSIPQRSGIGGFIENMIPAIQQSLASTVRDPAIKDAMLKQAVRDQERRRLQRASEESQAVTGLISSAMTSGDPTKFAEAVKQLSGLKKLEPETMASVRDFMLKMSTKMGEDVREKQEEAAMGEVLRNLPQAEAQVMGRALEAGMKPGDVMKLYSSGLLKPKKSLPEQMAELQAVLGSQPGGASGMQPTYNLSKDGELSVSLGPPVSGIQMATQELSAFMPQNHPRFDEMRGKYMAAQKYVGEMTQNVALRRVYEEIAEIMNRDKVQAQKDVLGRAGVTQEQYDRAFQTSSKVEKPKQSSTTTQAEKLGNADTGEMILNVAPDNRTAQTLFDEVAKEKARIVEVETQARERAKRDYGDLPVKLRDELDATAKDIAIARYASRSFSDADLKKYVGMLNMPYNTLKSFFVSQFGLGSKKAEQEMKNFTRFKNLARTLFSGVFEIGGKQLTPYEGAVVEDIRVTGKEAGGWIEFKTKLESMIAFGEASVKNKLEFYRTAPKDLDPLELAKRMEKHMEERLAKEGWIPGKSFQEVYDSKSKTFKYSYPGAK